MKFVHAVWEQRNMGVDCWELHAERNDTAQTILQFEKEHIFDYAVVRIPADYPEMLFQIGELGYTFAETLTSCHYMNHMPYTLSPLQQRFYQKLDYHFMKEQERFYLYERIRQGLFLTDRVSLDPHFTLKQSAERYIGWIGDEISRNALLYQIDYKQQPAGFFGIRPPENGACFAFLGGIYPEYQRLGLGVLMNCLEIEAAKEMGAIRTSTAFSSNNRGAYAVHLSMQYVLDRVDYIFVKHRENR